MVKLKIKANFKIKMKKKSKRDVVVFDSQYNIFDIFLLESFLSD